MATEAPETTEPADTTAPSDTTAPEEGDEETPWWILILVGIGVLILIVVLVSGGSKQTVVTAAPATWKDNARKGYAEARWLYDAMGEDMAVWRGNAQFEGTTGVDATAATNRAATWAELQRRQGEASDALYALEASAPDNRSAEAARATITTMRGTRDALDARAEARYSYRKAEAEGAEQSVLSDARDREVRASRNLAESRNGFAKALTDLSTLV